MLQAEVIGRPGVEILRRGEASVLRLVQGVAKAGQEQGVPVSLCGEMAADPRFTWVLVGLGVRELSMHPSAIPVIKNIIRSSDISEMEELAQRVLAAPDVDEAERLVLSVMSERFPEHLEHGGGQPWLIERKGRS